MSAPNTVPGTAPVSSETRPATRLSMDQLGKCNSAAQLDGTLYGTAAGFLGGLFGFRFLKLNKNISLLSGIMTGVISGYVVTQQALQTRIAKAEADLVAEEAARREKDGGVDPFDLNRTEGGFGGMEGFEDKYATTSGEH